MSGAAARRPVVETLVPGRTGWSLGPFSGVLRPRYLWMLLALVVLCCAVLVVAIAFGLVPVPLGRLLPALLGIGDEVDVVVASKRSVRVLLGLTAGFALGSAGGLTQSLTRNPLASPDILGVSAGASVFAVAAIIVPASGAAPFAIPVPVAAFLGGLLTTGIVLLLTWRRGLDPLRLVLVGIAITAICGAITNWLLLRTESEWAALAMRWMAGSVSGATRGDVLFLAPVCLLGMVGMLFVARPLQHLRLGPERARSLGVRTGGAQLAALLLAVALVSFATAVAGPIGFVAFVAPQIAMRLFGTAGPPVLAAGIVGALVVAVADLGTRWLPVDLPVGVITSLIGGPVLLVLLFRYVRRTSA